MSDPMTSPLARDIAAAYYAAHPNGSLEEIVDARLVPVLEALERVLSPDGGEEDDLRALREAAALLRPAEAKR